MPWLVEGAASPSVALGLREFVVAAVVWLLLINRAVSLLQLVKVVVAGMSPYVNTHW